MTHALPEPVPAINTTPLIDVMLVLLIMFIITIPLQTHAVKLDLPGEPPPKETIHPIVNRVGIGADGQVRWNGSAVSFGDLRALVSASAQLEDQPELQLLPDEAARYALVDEVLALTKQAGVTRMGFVGNERYRNF